MVEANKTYVGVVEDNQDPEKMGRVKVRVMDVFDEFDVEDIPWAMPWKDLNGNQFNSPEKGKVVMVVFDQGNPDSPEFIYSDHYNINLENKLKSLSDEDYISMKSLIFDHKTQIYVNDSEGLKLDHKYNNINLTENGIDLNLKDNNLSLNLGDASASQQAILGNHFMEWMDKFLTTLQSGALFNAGGPTAPMPALIKSITEFKALKDLKFLSHHVNIVDNNKVTTVSGSKREDEAQYGDKWVSTKEDNEITELKSEEFKPSPGPKEEYNKPVDETQPETNVQESQLGTTVENPAEKTDIGVDQNLPIVEEDNTELKENPKVERIIKFMESKNYKVFKEKGILNMVAFRDKDNGVITDRFDETLFVFYIDNNSEWQVKEYQITTVPGKICTTPCLKDIEILALGQYIDQCVFNTTNSIGSDSYRQYGKGLIFNQCAVQINNSEDVYSYSTTAIIKNRTDARFGKTEFPIGIFNRSKNALGSSEIVSDSSFGDQIFKSSNQFKEFLTLCEEQEKIKKSFTYTLCNKVEFDKFN
jgi:hypothetical protein